MTGKNLTRVDENAVIANSVVTRTKVTSTERSNIEGLTDAKTSNGNEINPAVRRGRRRSALTNLNNNVTQITANINTSKANSRAPVSNIDITNNNSRPLGSRSLQQASSKKDRQVQIKKDLEDNDYKQREDGKLIPANQPSSLKTKRAAPDSITHQADKKAKIEYTWDDLDEEDIDDPLMVSEYVVEIFEYLHKLEKETLPDPNYLQSQPNLQPVMRSILTDWMVEIHMRFRLLPETLYLSINLMDRFLSTESVEVEKVQLLATSCLFIAAKYEEVYSPSVRNYAIVTDGGFTEEDILQAEKAVIEVLEFNMSYPNPMNFLRRISKADDYQVRTRTLGKYLLEITVVDYKFLGVTPSLAAAAAMYVARKIFGSGPWNNNLIHYSGGYTEDDLATVCRMLVKYLVSPIVHEEFFKKYASRKFIKASIIARQWAKALVNDGLDVMD